MKPTWPKPVSGRPSWPSSPGSLGRLEDLSIQVAGITGRLHNRMEHKHLLVFAADNGVVAEGVSSAPQSVTLMQTINLTRHKTGASTLCRHFGCGITVCDVGVNADILEPKVLNRKIAYGTQNIAEGHAMTHEQTIECFRDLRRGKQALAAEGRPSGPVLKPGGGPGQPDLLRIGAAEMTIYLIRHGKTLANERRLYCGSTELSLSEQGREELNGIRFDISHVRFLPSGKKRANETMELLFPGVLYEQDPRFREVDFGIFEMQSYEELKDRPDYQIWLTGDNERNVPPAAKAENR